jgi:molybdenum cofactor cytidylyltransferase
LATGAAGSANWDAIVLAAGAGSRFGGGKLMTPWGDGVLLDAALATAFAAPVRSVRVTWGADPRIPAAATAFAARNGVTHRLRLVHAHRSAEGMANSLQAAIEDLPGDSAGLFVFLGDMPRVPHRIAFELARAVLTGSRAAAPHHAGHRGHPVLFAAALYPKLLALSGDRGAASVLRDLGPGLALIPAPDDGVLFDVDRPSDLG